MILTAPSPPPVHYSWSQDIGVGGFPLAIIVVAIILAICFGAWLLFGRN